MSLDKKKIGTAIDELAVKWETCGHLTLMKDGNIVHSNHYGFTNRDKKETTKEDSTYLINGATAFFSRLAIIKLVDEKKMKLSDKVSKHIPEYVLGETIKVEHLLRHQSGIKDFYHDVLMVELESDEEYNKLHKHDRVRQEYELLFNNYKFEDVYPIIKDHKLQFTPGKDERYSDTDYVFITEIVERVSGMKLAEYLDQSLFTPLGMKVKHTSQSTTLSYCEHNRQEMISVPFDKAIENVFSVTMDDLNKLVAGIVKKEIVNEKLWNKVTKLNKEGEAMLVSNANGFNCVSTNYLGFDVMIYFNLATGIAFHTVTNEEPRFVHDENGWQYFRKSLRGLVTSMTTYPRDTKMVKVNKKNFWHASDITIKENQHDFVLDTKTSIGMGLLYKTKTAYVQMEGDLAVGLLVLEIDKKKENYNIDIIIIDQKYQGKGYGKLMVKWAVDTLKEAGAKELTIGVNRENEAAKKVYLNAGFVPDSVYDGGMGLKLTL